MATLEGHAFIASSLDGFIARTDHEIDWLNKQPLDGDDHGYEAFVARMDGVILGRHSFRKVRSFPEWPYKKPVVVLSRTLTQDDIPAPLRRDDRVRIAGTSPSRLAATLAAEGWRRAYIDGGATIQSFLRAGLLNEITITQVPILLGAGRRLFGPLEEDIDLELREVRSYRSGLVATRYRVLPSTPEL